VTVMPGVSCIRVVQWQTQHFTVYTKEKSSYSADNTIRQRSANCGPWPNCGPFSTFYWAAQHLLLRPVWYASTKV